MAKDYISEGGTLPKLVVEQTWDPKEEKMMD
jgi:hypothetical protein